ncbi:SGNH/GDSL hydrolase family protein [Ilumatobacter sp.]|uniref:SGNH/GDSL hydrolase family protein n=1 Tax=Ilumatobacter sp. TaxID=1967498 RepID=UPI003B51A00A
MRTSRGVACRVASALAIGVLGAGCGGAEPEGSDGVAPSPGTGPAPTVAGVGRLPAPLPTPPRDGSIAVEDGAGDDDVTRVRGATSETVELTVPIDADGDPIETIAERTDGDRLIVVGDSILASSASRYGGELCAALNPLGWDVEVDAEPGRFVEFGSRVLEDRLPDDGGDRAGDVQGDDASIDDFDAAVIHLGSNYGGDAERYFTELNEILFRLVPRPTLLLTVSEYEPEWAEVNDAIRELAQLYDQVTVLEWGELAEAEGILGPDGLHPTDFGQTVLVEQLALALGEVGDVAGSVEGSVDPATATDPPVSGSATDDVPAGSDDGSTEPGVCLPTEYTDDSADPGRPS